MQDKISYQQDYYDGMTAKQWTDWAKTLQWLYGASQSVGES